MHMCFVLFVHTARLEVGGHMFFFFFAECVRERTAGATEADAT